MKEFPFVSKNHRLTMTMRILSMLMMMKMAKLLLMMLMMMTMMTVTATVPRLQQEIRIPWARQGTLVEKYLNIDIDIDTMIL